MKIYILLVLCVLFWSGNFILGRYVNGQIEPVQLAAFRWFAVALLLFPVFLNSYKKIFLQLKQDFIYIFLISLFGIVGFNTFVYSGLQYTTATNALLINSAVPLLILFFSTFMLNQSISIKQFLGIIFSTFGVVYILMQADISNLRDFEFNQGDIWIIASGLCWTFYSILLKKKTFTLSHLEFLSTVVLIGSVILLVIYIVMGYNFKNDTVLIYEYYWVLGYIVLFPSLLSFFFWHKAVEEIGASQSSQFAHLMPVFGTILAVIFLDEVIEAFHIVGGFFIAFGIYLSLFKKKKII